MKWIKRLAFATVALAFFALLLQAWLPKPVPADLALVKRGGLRVMVEEDGRTRVTDRYVVSAPITGNLGRINLRAGDSVELGQILARIVPVSPPLLDARTRAEAEARMRAAVAARRQAEASTSRAEAAYEYARRDAERVVNLERIGSSSEQDAERALLERRRCEEELNSARFGERVAEHQLAMAKAALGIVSARASAQMEVPAPVEGRVLRVIRESEGVVQMGAQIIEIGEPEALEIVVDVLTEDAVKIREGAPVSIVRWGGETSLAARVRLVEPSAFTKVSALGVEEQRVNVIIDLDEPYERWAALGDGYRVEAQITVLELDDVVKVPASAVFRTEDHHAAFVVAEGTVVETIVTVAETTGIETRVTNGLVEGEVVVTYPTDAIRDGVQVVQR